MLYLQKLQTVFEYHGCASTTHLQQTIIDELPFPLPPWTLLIPTVDGETSIVKIPTDISINDINIPNEVKFVSFSIATNRL